MWLKTNPLASRRLELSTVRSDGPPMLVAMMQECWADESGSRSTFHDICKRIAAAASKPNTRTVLRDPPTDDFIKAWVLYAAGLLHHRRRQGLEPRRSLPAESAARGNGRDRGQANFRNNNNHELHPGTLTWRQGRSRRGHHQRQAQYEANKALLKLRMIGDLQSAKK